MEQIELTAINKNDERIVFSLFSVWSLFTLCRPQDYLPFLALIRPSLTFGLITLAVYLLNLHDRPKIIKNGQFKLYHLLILVMVCGIPFSYYRSGSLRDVFDYASVNIIFFVLLYQVVNTKEKLKSILFTYACGASIYATYVLVFGNLFKERIAFGSMFDPNDIAFFIINFITFNFLFLESNKLKRIIAVVNIILGLVVMFKTGSRGGFVAFLAILSYLLLVRTKTLKISFLKKSFLVLLAISFLWSLSLNTERYKTILNVSTDYNIVEETGRVAIWKIGMRMMLSNPLTGVGMGRFSEGVGRDRETRGLPSAKWQTAHNSFVQIGAETGVIGFILFSLMSIQVIRITGRVMARSRSEDLIKITEMIRAGFLGHLVCAMFLSQAYSVYWVFYIALSARLQQMLEEEYS